MNLFVGIWVGSSSGKGREGKGAYIWWMEFVKIGSGKDKGVGGTGLECSDGCV